MVHQIQLSLYVPVHLMTVKVGVGAGIVYDSDPESEEETESKAKVFLRVLRHKRKSIDNYDSFTFNVEHQLLMLDQADIIRNDKISSEEISQLDYDAFVIGPGPSNPKNAEV